MRIQQQDTSETTSSASRRLLRSVVLLGACLAILGVLAARALGAPIQPQIQSGSFRVQITDPSGKSEAVPFFNISDAYPKMPPIITSLTIRNAGTLPATYTLNVADLQSSRYSVADVLLVRVTGPSGSVLYQGGLQGMSFQGAELRGVGALATYRIEIRWPDHGASDRRYQGQTISFGLRLASELTLGSP